MVKLTTKLDSDSEQPKFVIDMPRMGKVGQGGTAAAGGSEHNGGAHAPCYACSTTEDVSSHP